MRDIKKEAFHFIENEVEDFKKASQSASELRGRVCAL